MKRLLLVLVAAALLIATPASALFTNGGFETGDFTGWTVEHGKSYQNDYNAIVWSSTPIQYAGVVSRTQRKVLRLAVRCRTMSAHTMALTWRN